MRISKRGALLLCLLTAPQTARALTPNPANADIPVNTTIANRQQEPVASSDPDGNFMVVWESQGQDVPAETTKFGVFGRIFNADASPASAEFQVSVTTADDQVSPHVAATTAGEFVAVWSSNGQDNAPTLNHGIYGRRFAADGTPLGGEFPVNTTVVGNQSGPGLAADANGNFVVVWQSPQDGNLNGIVARIFDSSGNPLSNEILVNTFTTGQQVDPDVAVAPDGGFIVTWRSDGQDGDGGGIFAQRFAANGTRLGSEIAVNTTTAGVQQSPMAGANHDGVYMIVWESVGQDGSLDGLFSQLYDADGNEIGSESAVNTFTAGNQEDPAISADVDGNFVVSWESDGIDGSGDGVVVRRFAANGAAIDASEFVVPFNVASSQQRAWVSADDLGGFAIAWQSTFNGTIDIFARRFEGDVSATPTPTIPPPSATPTVVPPTATPTSPPPTATPTIPPPTATPTSPPPTTTPTNPPPTATPTSAPPTATPTATPPQATPTATPSPTPGGEVVLCDGLVTTIVGTQGPDTIYGTPGNDVIHSRGGADIVHGLQGNDVICGDGGRDRLNGDAGVDRIFGGDEDDVLSGNGGNDQLFGDSGNDRLIGGPGIDGCSGGGGTNTLSGCEN